MSGDWSDFDGYQDDFLYSNPEIYTEVGPNTTKLYEGESIYGSNNIDKCSDDALSDSDSDSSNLYHYDAIYDKNDKEYC